MRLPSVKNLESNFPGCGAELRRCLASLEHCHTYKSVQDLIRQCYNEPNKLQKRLTALNEVGGFFGVEYQSAGRNAKSAGFHFLNSGDLYTPTLIKVDGGSWLVGCVADLLERSGTSYE